MRNNIVLIGFMGCGKTTVGKELAKRLKCKFYDTDEMIEKNENMKISNMFERYGEKYFRDAETRLITEMADNMENAIISTGGGLPLREGNAEILKKVGLVVYLRAGKETTYRRVKHDKNRPLLAVENVKERIEELINIRTPFYAASSHISIETDGRHVEDIVAEIMLSFEKVV